MNLKKAFVVVGLAVTAIGVPGLASAQYTGFYAGGALGQAEAKDGCGGIGFVGGCDDKDAAWKIFGGYQFNRNLGVELGFTDLGEFTATGTFLGAPGTSNAKADGFDLVAVGTLPISEQLAIYGKAGFFLWNLDVSVAGAGVSRAAGADGTDLTYGIGMKYSFTRNLAGRLEWQRYNDVGDNNTTGRSDIDVIGIGVAFTF